MSMNTSQYIWDTANTEWVKVRGTANGDISVTSSPNFVGTAAECQIQANLLDTTDVGIYTFFATDTNRYGYLSAYAGGTGTITWDATSGATIVSTLPSGVTRIRESTTLGTSPEIFDFSATPIIAATIYCNPVSTLTTTYASAVVCIDPATDAIRDAWLTAADSLAADSQRIPVNMGESIELHFTSAVDYIGAKIDIGTDQQLKLTIVGVEA